MTKKRSANALISDLKRKTRKRYSSEEKIRIIIEGMRGETTMAELCRREGISQANYYKWSKDFMEAGKRRLNGDTMREANTPEVQELKNFAQTQLENRTRIQMLIDGYSKQSRSRFKEGIKTIIENLKADIQKEK